MEEERQSSVVIASVSCSPARRVHISWGSGNELRLLDIKSNEVGGAKASSDYSNTSYGAPTPTTSTSSTSGASSQHTVVKWGWQSGAERRVCYDCMQPWLEIQKQRTMGLCSASNWWTRVLEYSTRVSQVLGRQDDIRVPMATPSNEEDLWIAIRRVVWELLEIFYVNQPVSLTAQMQDFVAWLQRNCQILTVFDSRQLETTETMLLGIYECKVPEIKENYWTCVQLFVLLGFNEAAIDLLGRHSAWTRWQNKDTSVRAQFEILESLMTILQKAPRLAGSTTAPLGAKVFTNVNEYNLYKSKWSLACRQLEQNDFLWQECSQSSEMTAKGAKAILQGLLGQEDTLKGCTRTWTELLCAQLLHRYPSIDSLSELSSLAEYCIENSSKDFEVIINILLAILNDNVQEAISLSSQTLGSWFMAHAPDLLDARQELHLTEVLRKPVEGRQGNQFEFFVLDFAEALMTNSSMWQTVCDYLAWCPTCGESALQIFLSHLPITMQEDKTTMQALEVASKHNLPVCAAQLCRAIGMHRWQQGQLGAAEVWLRRGHDERRLKKIKEAAAKTKTDLVEKALKAVTPEDVFSLLEENFEKPCAKASLQLALALARTIR